MEQLNDTAPGVPATVKAAPPVPALKDLLAIANDVQTPDEVAALYYTIKFYQDKAKAAMEVLLKQRGPEVFKDAKITGYDLTEGTRMILGEKKKDVFVRDKIFDTLALTESQRAVFNTNCFLKSAVTENKEIAGYYAQDIGAWELSIIKPQFTKKKPKLNAEVADANG